MRSDESKCEKCGSDDILIRYHAIGEPFTYTQQKRWRWPVESDSEYLVRYCRTCTYEWRTPVLPPPPAPSVPPSPTVEPSKCPSCGSPDPLRDIKSETNGCYYNTYIGLDSYSVCRDLWHDDAPVTPSDAPKFKVGDRVRDKSACRRGFGSVRSASDYSCLVRWDQFDQLNDAETWRTDTEIELTQPSPVAAPTPAATTSEATDPRRVVGAVVHGQSSNVEYVVITPTGVVRRADLDNTSGCGDLFPTDVFVRWATREECERHGIPYVERGAAKPTTPAADEAKEDEAKPSVTDAADAVVVCAIKNRNGFYELDPRLIDSLRDALYRARSGAGR